jgi:hypothetical protein
MPAGPMLATAGEPPAGLGWIVEAKHDDARGIARLYDGDAHIQSRPGNNLVARFPDLVESLWTVLDGHTVILAGDRCARQGWPTRLWAAAATLTREPANGRAERRRTRELLPLSGQ